MTNENILAILNSSQQRNQLSIYKQVTLCPNFLPPHFCDFQSTKVPSGRNIVDSLPYCTLTNLIASLDGFGLAIDQESSVDPIARCTIPEFNIYEVFAWESDNINESGQSPVMIPVISS